MVGVGEGGGVDGGVGFGGGLGLSSTPCIYEVTTFICGEMS